MAIRETASAHTRSDGLLDVPGREVALEHYRVDARSVAEAMLRKLALADHAHRAVERHGVDPGADRDGAARGVAGLG
jgi:hypothetical protein